MIALADAEEAPEGHHRIGDLPRYLVDHHAVDRTKMLALQIIDGGATTMSEGIKRLVSPIATLVPG